MKNKEILNLLKNKHIQTLGIIFIIGIVFMIGSGGLKKENNTAEQKSTVQNLTEEERLSEILSDIDGAGKVSVMITYYGTAEKNLAYETKTESIQDDVKSESTEEKSVITAKDEPMVVNETYPKVKGVIITAEGADSAYVRQAIAEGAAAVLDVAPHRICIYKKED